MQEDKPSVTAQLVAGLRAAHYQSAERPLVFSDPYAASFTGGLFLEPLQRGELQKVLAELKVLPMQGGVLGRARYAEDCLEAAIAEVGATQFVMLGAGNDSFVLRRPDLLERLQVFEVDFPASQRAKRQALAELGFRGHANLHFVPVDFERESAGDALARSRFDTRAVTFINWLGVVCYLSREALVATLRSLRAVCAVESRIVFDYLVAMHLLSLEAQQISESTSRGTASVGESRSEGYVPEELFREVCSLGYQVIEDLTPEMHYQRYFAQRRDGMRPNPTVHLLQLRMRA
jgi:methyltransferase (TIGR00027 family)